jgi:phosphocarrier protein
MEVSRDIEIINKLGMHARAAAKFVKLATSFDSNIDIQKGSRRVNAKSIMGVMMLAANKGSTITIHADGSDAEKSLDALEQLIKNRFDEDE